MNFVYGVMVNCSSGKSAYIRNSNLKYFDLELLDLVWDVGLDQSTSCFGICFQDVERNYVILLDVSIDKNMSKFETYKQLFSFLKQTVNGKKIRHVIMEKPVPSKYKSAGYILRELKGHVEEWCMQIPELERATIDSIFPQSWKSVIVDKKKGKNRSNVKREVASDVVDIIPALSDYFNTYRFTDYDSFDACGLLNGYLICNYTADGVPMIYATKEKRHTSFVCYRQVKLEVLKKEFKGIFGEFLPVYKPVFRAYNHSYNKFNNIRMASSKYRAIGTILPDSEMEPLIWQFGLEPDEDSCVLMYVFRKGEFTSSEIKLLKRLFPWNEEVQDLS